ncbi:hypothetical protein [Sphaerisporangium dianthi]|uniref:Uncharacterized protein n=1 Tax=Sphaerisporangium dianthi TaxID=1436120 RepID=A0ABV9CAX9_9ACTN
MAALNVAFIRHAGPWRLVGDDGPSSDLLIAHTADLLEGRRFPEATQSLAYYRWSLVGHETPPGKGLRLWRRRRAVPVTIQLEMADAPGGFYHRGHPSGRNEAVDALAGSQGIIIFYDPLREYRTGDTFAYLHGALTELAERMLASAGLQDGMLPHHVAICVTKFDEFKVVTMADRLGLLTADSDESPGFPQVAPEDAEELFAQLCQVSASGDAKLMLPALKQFFRPERIKFFVSSSIGFYVDPRTGTFDRDDFQNLVPDTSEPWGDQAGRAPRIRGSLYPVNVMEPVTWLARHMSPGTRDHGK